MGTQIKVTKNTSNKCNVNEDMLFWVPDWSLSNGVLGRCVIQETADSSLIDARGRAELVHLRNNEPGCFTFPF